MDPIDFDGLACGRPNLASTQMDMKQEMAFAPHALPKSSPRKRALIKYFTDV